jgi:hypothetical protein
MLSIKRYAGLAITFSVKSVSLKSSLRVRANACLHIWRQGIVLYWESIGRWRKLGFRKTWPRARGSTKGSMGPREGSRGAQQVPGNSSPRAQGLRHTAPHDQTKSPDCAHVGVVASARSRGDPLTCGTPVPSRTSLLIEETDCLHSVISHTGETRFLFEMCVTRCGRSAVSYFIHSLELSYGCLIFLSIRTESSFYAYYACSQIILIAEHF